MNEMVFFLIKLKNIVRGTIWYHLYNLKNVENTHGGVLIASACNFTKSYSNKPHGHDMIDICMLEICSASIYRPLKIIYKARLEVFSF